MKTPKKKTVQGVGSVGIRRNRFEKRAVKVQERPQKIETATPATFKGNAETPIQKQYEMGISLPKPLEVFVMMPSGSHDEYLEKEEEADFIFRHIVCNGIEKAKQRLGVEMNVKRATDNRVTGSITSDIVKRTAGADIAIVDVTGLNPNVFFELGMRYAIREATTILLRNQDVRLPFDVNVYRAISYRKLQFEHAANELADVVVHSVTSQAINRDSLVYDVFPEMEVRIPGIYESGYATRSGHTGLMPWVEFHERINTVINVLRDVVKNGLYVPDVVLGISNGGLIVADLLVRSLFENKPLLALWANRSAGLQMFRNEVNQSLLKTILRPSPNDGTPLEVLLVDDIVSTGSTISLARQFLEQNLGSGATVRFLPMFSRNQKYREIIRGFLLYDDQRIPRRTDEEIQELMTTPRRSLPYNKDIRE